MFKNHLADFVGFFLAPATSVLLAKLSEASGDLSMLTALGSPAAMGLFLWYMLTRYLPRKDEAHATSMNDQRREFTEALAKQSDKQAAAIDHQTEALREMIAGMESRHRDDRQMLLEMLRQRMGSLGS